jgi:hypothetical protein
MKGQRVACRLIACRLDRQQLGDIARMLGHDDERRGSGSFDVELNAPDLVDGPY